MRRAHWPWAEHIVARPLHALLQPNHVHHDLHDGGKQREGAAPRCAQRRAAIDHLADQVLDTATVVLYRRVELALLRRQVAALPLGDQLRLLNVDGARRPLFATGSVGIV